ncbi:MAG: NAD-dependent epimerase/dehydratase family protein [Calditrichaeota bacterium]|nr:MAG: NAD-dependent epimerase/dehydratase family protein [Calditrichota bacterium]
MYTILGATGNTGRVVAEKLLAAGKPVRVVGRNRERLEPFVEKGAQPFVGSVTDADFLAKAFDGATAVYALIPPNMQVDNFLAYQNQVGEAITKAIEKAGITRVVNLSSMGAHLPEGTGPIRGLYFQEQRLNALSGVHVLHLRAGFFMENLLFQVDLIKNQGICGSPMRGDLPMYLIATRDIGEYAAGHLLELDFSGQEIHALSGPRDYTMVEATRILGAAIGKPDLPYVQFPYEDAEQAFIQMGIGPDIARSYIEMYRGFNEGIGIAPTPDARHVRTKTSLEEFADFFAAVYRAG